MINPKKFVEADNKSVVTREGERQLKEDETGKGFSCMVTYVML